MSLVYRNRRRRLQESSSVHDDSGENSIIADGTALSILEWSLQPDINLDAEQQNAFQIVTAAFIIT
jgi:hypothetical protein